MPCRPVISLLTDFGYRDAYAGIMKGVIYGINPDVEVVDICHEIGPQDILEAAYILKSAYRYFPGGTIHTAVIDPGVGTDRRAVAFSAGDWFFIGPDNGLFSYILRDEKVEDAVELTNSEYQLERVGETFHGRDVFAPAAAYIAAGVDLKHFGPPVMDLQKLDGLEPSKDGCMVKGQIIHIDRFGNCITNIERSHVPSVSVVTAGNAELSVVSQAYGDVSTGEVLAIFGSSGHLEIAVNYGSAADKLGLRKWDEVTVCCMSSHSKG